jgi:hypothetical protein
MVEAAEHTMSLAELKRDFATGGDGDPWGDTMGALFPACEELYCRLLADESITDEDLAAEVATFLNDEAKFRPCAVSLDRFRAYLTREAGRDPADPQDGGNFWAANAADADTAALLRFARLLNRNSARIRKRGEDY